LSDAPTQFGPDTTWNYEFGGKTEWLDHRLRVNVAAYYMKWSDIQEFTNMACGYGFTSNIATAKSQGVELEMKTVLSDRWAAGGTFSRNKASYTSSLPGAGIVDGNRLESAPETTGSLYLDYSRPTPGLADWELGAHAEFAYTGNMQYAYPSQNPTYPLVPSYSVVNGRVSLTKDSLSLSLFANNILDRVNLNYLGSFHSNFLDLYHAGVLPPRTVGIAIDKRF
jgi:outer membrane receptor protein involved in Fe transport